MIIIIIILVSFTIISLLLLFFPSLCTETINSNQSETKTSNAPDHGDQERISLFSLARTGSVKL